MGEIKFLIRQDGDTIHVCNKNAGYYLGFITIEDEHYRVPGEDKRYVSKNDALSRLIEIKVRGEN